ncbi:MAG: CBS domain-containing protein [Candidatus Verstraetearchaeota archaeon]|nr:CBS domain-containing protein [Candidatus Verstraetearchaeota archaeon]
MLPTPSEIRILRKKAGLTQKELAKRAGVSQSLIARIEAGTVDPRLSTLRRILKAIEEASKEKMAKITDIMTDSIISVQINDKVKKAVELMWKYGVSQLPVLDGTRLCGSIREETIMKAMITEKPERILEEPVGELMEEPLPSVNPRADIEDVIKLLISGYPAVLVIDKGKVIGIITKIDVIAKATISKRM